MKIEFRSSNVPLSDPLRDHAVRRLELALRPLGDRVARVVVRLVDINGPRGGADKRCRMVAHLLPSGRLLVEATDADAHVAVSQAVRRLDERLVRRLTRRPRPPATRHPSARGERQRLFVRAAAGEPSS